METVVNVWQKTKIKNIEFKNRIVRSATNEHLGTLDGLITDDYIKTYEILAQNEVGLLITSHMAIDKTQRADITHICVNESKNFTSLKSLTSKVHSYGSKIIAQISYGGHKVNSIPNQIAKTPSGIDNSIAMTEDDINDCINSYVKTIETLQDADFDGVQLHMAHGYLLSEFLDPFYNKRSDDFGGNVNNRYKIIHEILTAINKVRKPDFLIIAKIDTISKDSDPNFINDQIKVCKWLEKDGLDSIELSGNNYRNLKQFTPYFFEQAKKIRNEISIPIILVGGFRNMEQINLALSHGIDFISMSRPFIAEDNFVQKLKNNETSRCINCNKCFEIYKTLHKRCVFRKDTVKQLEINFPINKISI